MKIGQGEYGALRKILKEELEEIVSNTVWRLMKPMVIDTIQHILVPLIKDLFYQLLGRTCSYEPPCSVEEELSTKETWNDLPEERTLQLMFSAEVCDTVWSGKELKGKNDDFLKLALVDANQNIVTDIPESSAYVEILLLEDKNNMMTCENFESSIITRADNQKPRFAKGADRVRIQLKNGVGYLSGLKLGNGSDNTKVCTCRLRARIVQTFPFRGTRVQEAWTEQFTVKDNRDSTKKHYPPNLSSAVWRLNKIARTGEPCKRLENKNVRTVGEFLFWLNVNPGGLQQILKAKERSWNAIVAHANTCIIDDNKTYACNISPELQVYAIYDAVGNLKGQLFGSYFVPSAELPGEYKDQARKVLSFALEGSGFEELNKKPFHIEAFLQQEIPSDINTSINFSSQQCLNGTLTENICGYQTMERDSQFQSIDHSNFYHSGPSHFLGSKETGELCNYASGPFPDSEVTGVGTSTDVEICCEAADADMWGSNEWRHGPPSPNPMLHYVDDSYSSNTRIYGNGNEPGGDEESGAASAEPQVIDAPNRREKVLRQWFSLKGKRERYIDVTCSSQRKKKVGY